MLTAANTTKTGCQRTCGNVTIPYPFGVGKDCALNDDYVVNCIIIRGEYYAVYVDEYTQLFNITETELTLSATPAAQSCNSAGKQVNNNGRLNVKGKPYAISSTANTFMVTGCHHYGLIEAETRTGTRKVVSCVALCTKMEDLLDDTCSGLGCCEAPLPKGLQVFNSSLEKIVYNTSVSPGNCSYAFIAKRGSIKFRRANDLQDPSFASRVAVTSSIMDWFIANATCKEAQRKLATYACKQNTSCVDLDQDLDVHGYRCKCLPGYEGNPYLSPGCTEIDECKGPSNPCSRICVNTPGSYQCRCPKGYHGDGRKDGTGCMAWTSRLAFPLGLGIGLGSILFIMVGYWLFIDARRRKKKQQKAKNFERNGGLLLQQQMSSKDGMIEKTRIFTADELEKATDNYNEDRVLGKGGQGTVYKGMLSDGNIVAIKRSNVGRENQLNHFINEVVILSQINHRNIVKLLGCCLETEVPLLVYEFVMNGTLFNHIHNPSEEFPITWKMRLQIASDAAAALAYLHSSSSIPILHRDIKSSNILLDDKYRGKLSDFGTSRSINVNQTHVTTRVMGTFGYLDPGYFHSNVLTEKSDVYSFGVVLVELLTGQKAIITISEEEEKSLSSWFLSHMENSRLLDIIDPQVLQEDISYEEFHTIAKLAERCLYLDGKRRPTMKEVLIEIEEVISVHIPEKNRKNCAETEQVCGEITDHSLHDTPLGSRTTNSLCSAEMSLMLNPR